jgi:DMSO/TMAO reductase YedYZ molybdopterin-dependent catalytic subunit
MSGEPAGAEGERRIGRGVFLGTVATGLSALVWGKSAWSTVSAAIAPAERLVPLVPSGWRIYTISGTMPTFDPSTWRLDVGGLVRRPVSLSYAELRSLPRAEQVSTFHCVTGWSVADVHWGGVRLSDLMDRVAPHRAAQALEFVSAEVPYVDYLTVHQAALPDVLLAYEMDGKPLPREHGAPVRLVIPEMYGYKNVKWLRRISFIPRTADGYWEGLGYDRDAWVGRSNGYGS